MFLPMDLPRERDWFAPIPQLELIYQRAEREAELAATAVQLAADRYRADRSEANTRAYAEADRRYDRARNAFQLASCNLMTAKRAAASAAQESRLAAAQMSF